MARTRTTLVASLLATLIFAATAAAAPRTVDCIGEGGNPDSADLRAALEQAVSPDVITIAQGATCFGHFDLPSGEAITLRGDAPARRLTARTTARARS